MKTARLVISVVAAAALLPLSATAALAAPPANDTPDGAIALNLGDTAKEDTTQATTDQGDARDNRACGAPFTNASVWYSYTPSADGTFVLDATPSNYPVGIMVFEGAPSPRSLITCGPTSVGANGTAGTTYTIMVFSAAKKNGGNLVMSLQEGPPPPTLAVSVDPQGQAFSNGTASVSGTYNCTDASVFMGGRLTQIWKRVKISGFFRMLIRPKNCDGTDHTWTKTVRSANGLYAPGTAAVVINSQACGLFDCVFLHTKKQVTLQKASGAPLGVNALRPSTLSLWNAKSHTAS